MSSQDPNNLFVEDKENSVPSLSSITSGVANSTLRVLGENKTPRQSPRNVLKQSGENLLSFTPEGQKGKSKHWVTFQQSPQVQSPEVVRPPADQTDSEQSRDVKETAVNQSQLTATCDLLAPPTFADSQNVSVDEEFNTPPTSPDKQPVAATGHQAKPVPRALQVIQDTPIGNRANDTIDDLSDIIGRLNLDSEAASKVQVNSAVNPSVDNSAKVEPESVSNPTEGSTDISGFVNPEIVEKPSKVIEAAEEDPEISFGAKIDSTATVGDENKTEEFTSRNSTINEQPELDKSGAQIDDIVEEVKGLEFDSENQRDIPVEAASDLPARVKQLELDTTNNSGDIVDLSQDKFEEQKVNALLEAAPDVDVSSKENSPEKDQTPILDQLIITEEKDGVVAGEITPSVGEVSENIPSGDFKAKLSALLENVEQPNIALVNESVVPAVIFDDQPLPTQTHSDGEKQVDTPAVILDDQPLPTQSHTTVENLVDTPAVSFVDQPLPTQTNTLEEKQVDTSAVSFDEKPLPTQTHTEQGQIVAPAGSFDDQPLPTKTHTEQDQIVSLAVSFDEQPLPIQIHTEVENQIATPAVSFDDQPLPTQTKTEQENQEFVPPSAVSFDDQPLPTQTRTYQDQIVAPVISFDDQSLPTETNTEQENKVATPSASFDDQPLPTQTPKEEEKQVDSSAVSFDDHPLPTQTRAEQDQIVSSAISFDDQPLPTQTCTEGVNQVSTPAASFDDQLLPTQTHTDEDQVVSPAVSFDDQPLPLQTHTEVENQVATPAASFDDQPLPAQLLTDENNQVVTPAVSFDDQPLPTQSHTGQDQEVSPAVSFDNQLLATKTLTEQENQVVAPAAHFDDKPLPTQTNTEDKIPVSTPVTSFYDQPLPTQTYTEHCQEVSPAVGFDDQPLPTTKSTSEPKEIPIADHSPDKPYQTTNIEDQPLPTATKAAIQSEQHPEDIPIPTLAGSDSKPIKNPLTENKMADDDRAESPIPMPKGSYNIDWDNFDFESMDPFATKSKVVNDEAAVGSAAKSPPVSNDSSASKPAKKASSAATKKTTKTPVKSKAKPTKAKTSPKVATPKADSPPPFDDSVDPFKPKKALSNSPTPDDNVDPFKSSKALANSPTPDDNIDPFKPLKALSNSPTPDDNIDPFKPAKALSNSPTPDDKIDPFKPSKALSNSPTPDDNIDPFAPSRALANTPPPGDIDLNQDPFKSTKALANSPVLGRKASDSDSNKAQDTSPPKETNNNEKEVAKDEPVKKSPTKKPASKLAKKGTPSRFKRPPKVKQEESEDIAIFAAPAPPKSNNASSQDSGVDVTGANTQDGQVEEEEFTLAPPPPEHLQMQQDLPDEEFTNANDVFNNPSAWEMLEKSGNSNTDSALARQSLYRKFDPLVKGAPSPAQKASKPRVHEIKSIAESDDLLLMNTPPSTAQRAKHPAARELENQLAQNGDVDKILACSPTDNGASTGNGNASLAKGSESPGDIVQVLKYSQSDVTRMRKEWDLELRGRFLAKERDYLQNEQKLKDEMRDVTSQLDKQKASVDDMKKIVAEYEVTINQLIADKENVTSASKDSLTDVIKERDQALEDIRSVETAFSDLHRRYEKTKQTLEGFKKNEETLKKCVTDYQQKLKKQEEKYQALKAHAEEKLEQANDEIEKQKRAQDSEIARLQAALKRAEMKVSSLETTVDQREKENKELTAICDELIAKVGVH